MTKIRKQTPKRAALERKYRKLQQEISEEREPICEGCGKGNCRITFSHRIPRNRNIQLLIDKDNIDLMCDECHELVEVGEYDKLQNGDAIMEYIERTDPEYYAIKTVLNGNRPQVIRIVYSGQQVSMNQYKSLHFRKLKKITDPMKLEMFALISNAKVPPMKAMELEVRYNSKLDVDNLSATSKILVDQLVKAGRLPDDKKKHWQKITIQYDPKLPHNTAEFLITPLDMAA